MLRVCVCVSGGGTNLQAIMDAIDSGKITNAEIVRVISNNKTAYALERAKNHGIDAVAVSPKDYETRELFNQALLDTINEVQPDLIVLAGFLVVIPKEMIAQYRNRIINIHPSLIPSFCGTGYYGLKVHEGTDTGPIILQKAVYVESGDTPKVLQQRVMEQAEWQILPQAIDMIANGRL